MRDHEGFVHSELKNVLKVFEEDEAGALGGGKDDRVQDGVRVQLMDRLDTGENEMHPEEVLHGGERRSEFESVDECHEEVSRGVEDEVPGEGHCEHGVGVGEESEGLLGKKEGGDDAAWVGVKEGQEVARQGVLSSKVAPVDAEGGAEVEGHDYAVGHP